MTSTIVAKRYARALFAIGKEEGRLEDYGELLQGAAGVLEADPEVASALESPVFPMEAKQQVVEELIRALQPDEVFGNFLRILVERRRIHYLGLIARAYQELVDEEKGVVRAVVKTAVPVPEELKTKLKEVLAKATGKEVALELSVDPSVIGGVVAHIGDMVWDGSIRSQLQGFKETIGRGELG